MIEVEIELLSQNVCKTSIFQIFTCQNVIFIKTHDEAYFTTQ